MKERIVSKDIINFFEGLKPATKSTKVSLKEMAEVVLTRYKTGWWNSSHTTFIELNIDDIKAIADGEKVKYKIAEIYRDGDTTEMEIIEVTE